MKSETGFFGFDSMSDFVESFLGFKHWLGTGIISIATAIASFISNYMWDDPVSVYLLWILMSADWISGVAKSMKKKKFSSYRFWRMPLYFVATSFVVSLSWWIAKKQVVYVWLPGLTMSGFYGVYFFSLLENLGELGLLPKRIIKLLQNKIGLEIFNRDKNENNSKRTK